MKYVIFENDGVLDAQFIKSFGVSIKQDESCIGFFGTGLKYALAILIRSGARVSIFSNGETMRFGKAKHEMKGKIFDFITMNGEMLPFTTELGKRWEPWMAYREIYSNALDEGGNVYESDELPDASDGRTYVVVAGAGINDLHRDKEAVFCDKANEVAHNMFPNGGSFYSKGVCVWRFEGMPSIYSYNDSRGECDLTEDRQIKYQFQVMRVITNLLALLTDKEMLERIILADIDMFEGRVDYDYCNVTPSKVFLEVASLNKDNIKNDSLVNYYKKHLPVKAPEPHELLPHQAAMLDRAIKSVKMAGFNVDDYPIQHVVQLPENALGMAKDGIIWVSRDVYDTGGLEMLKATLIEEWVHLKYGYGDCERNMQNYLFSQLVRLVDFFDESMRQKYAA